MKSPQAYQIPERVKKIFLALARALIVEPGDLIINNKESEFLERIQIMLAEFVPLMRFGFLFILSTFNWAPFLFGFGFSRFTHLKPDAQKNYVEKFLTTNSTLLRELFKTLRGIVMIAYFSHHDVWKYIGYDPQNHVRERIALRNNIIHQSSPGGEI